MSLGFTLGLGLTFGFGSPWVILPWVVLPWVGVYFALGLPWVWFSLGFGLPWVGFDNVFGFLG